MYDDLAKSQRRGPLELLVVNLLIPSILTTFVLQSYAMSQGQVGSPREKIGFTMLEPLGCPLWEPFSQPPDVFPQLMWIPPPHHRRGVAGRVLLKAVVDINGRVRPSSIVTLRTTAAELVLPARYALEMAVFRPALLQGRRIEAWVTMAVEFDPLDDTVDVR